MKRLSIAELDKKLLDQKNYRPLHRVPPKWVMTVNFVFNAIWCLLIVLAGTILWEPKVAPVPDRYTVRMDGLPALTEDELFK